MKCGKLLLVLFLTMTIYAGISQTTVYAASEGATLYAQYCASCHSATPSGARVNASAAKITNAIATNSDMKNDASLKTLTSAQIQAISSFLSGSTGDTGSSLFLSNCISCHNTIPATDPRLVGATAAKITNAIATISQMKGSSALQGLTSTQIQSISDYIAGTGQSSNWIIAGVGDFNGDGSVDIFWRDTINGYNYVWLMNGTSISSGLWLPTFAGNTWLVEGVGDFNQDGYADILLRNISTGENVIWLMKNGAIQSSITLPTLSDRNWVVAAIGDFNGDKYPDIVWRHLVYGYNGIWYFNGTTVSGVGSLPQLADASWVICGAADMEYDGNTDLVLRNKTAGYNYVWDLSGSTVVSAFAMPQISDTSWTIAALGKPDSNGYVNVFWRNQNSGSTVILTMHGGTMVMNAVALPTFGP